MDTPPGRRARFDRRTVLLSCALACAVLVGAVAVVLATRDGSSDRSGPPLATSTSTTSPSNPARPGAPVIVGFDVPKVVRCNQATAIAVSWTTTGAVGVQIGIDGPGAFGYYPPTGRAKLPFPCDRSVHTYRLVAVAPTGAMTSRVAQARPADS